MPPSMDKSKEAAPMTSPIKPQGPLDEHQHKNTISIKQDPPDVAIFQQKINQLAIELILAREDDVSLENIQLKHQQLERLAQQHARVAMAKRHGTEFILVTASKIMKDFCNSSPEILSAYPQGEMGRVTTRLHGCCRIHATPRPRRQILKQRGRIER